MYFKLYFSFICFTYILNFFLFLMQFCVFKFLLNIFNTMITYITLTQVQAILFKCLNSRIHYRHIVFRSLFGDISRSGIYRETWIFQGNLRAVGKTNLHRRTKSRRTEIVLVK